MRLQLAPLGGQRHVDQRLIVQQRREHRDEIRLVVVPAQAELLHGHVGAVPPVAPCSR